jgi:hypothetical protein
MILPLLSPFTSLVAYSFIENVSCEEGESVTDRFLDFGKVGEVQRLDWRVD